MTIKELVRSGREFLNGVNCWGVTPGGNADVYQRKGLAGKAIRKTMKTKGRQNRFVRSGQRVAAIRLPLEATSVEDWGRQAGHGER